MNYCSGCGALQGAGHLLGCSDPWYTTTSNNTSGYQINMGYRVCGTCGVGYATSLGHVCVTRCNLHFSTLPCAWCQHALLTDDTIINAPYSQQEEPLANNIDEQQITLLDNMRSARDAAYRYAQSKHDRATLMRIQSDALEAEGNEIVSEINEGVPAPESE